MDFGLKDQVVMVTGSSAGIGRAAAVAFAAEGARVAVTYHENRPGAEATAEQARAAGGQALVVHYDLADLGSIRSSVESIQKEWGALNVLVNNAVLMSGAGPTGKPFEELSLERWQDTLRGNLEGTVLTINCALPLMRPAGWGRIVSISSDAVDGWPGLGAYATVKAGLHGLSRTMAKELSPAGILSNVVMPGFVLTEHNRQRVPEQYQEQVRQMLPTRILPTPEDIAAVILFLGSRVNRQITGEVIRVTGGRHG
jgi:NAD(P)-dependent dehydrogenase (short-subunit alcohol dehydrogenase family)